MATYHAIAATGRALLDLLREACPKSEFPNAQFDFLPIVESKKVFDEGITLYLYRVGANPTRRNVPPRPQPDGRVFLPAVALDLYYLITAWAQDAEQQHRLLGWTMRALDDTPILPAGLLNSVMAEHDIFHPEETVELIFEPLSLADMATLWENLRPKGQLSVTYVARMVCLESKVERTLAREVQTREFDFAK